VSSQNGCPPESNPNNCLGYQETVEWFKSNSKLSVYYTDSYADLEDKEQTLKYYINDFYFVNVNEMIDKRTEMFLKKGRLDHSGVLPGIFDKTEDFLQLGELSTFEGLTPEIYIYKGLIRLSNKKVQITRKDFDILIMLAEVGGLSTAILAVFKFIVTIFAKRIFSTDILGNLFLVKRLSKNDVADESDDESDNEEKQSDL
jgi:hypothetical protein